MTTRLKAGALIFISREAQPIDFTRECQVGYPYTIQGNGFNVINEPIPFVELKGGWRVKDAARTAFQV